MSLKTILQNWLKKEDKKYCFDSHEITGDINNINLDLKKFLYENNKIIPVSLSTTDMHKIYGKENYYLLILIYKHETN